MTFIPGLTYYPNFISDAEESELIKNIDEGSWSNELKRRVQHYGFKYDYRTRNISKNHYLGPLPKWLSEYCSLLHDRKIFSIIPTQVIVNEYEPGQGIAAHIDCITCFGDTIASISLFSSCSMNFQKNLDKKSLFLESRSLLILKQEARYKWQHSISCRKTDQYEGKTFSRRRRLSLTFRNILQ